MQYFVDFNPILLHKNYFKQNHLHQSPTRHKIPHYSKILLNLKKKIKRAKMMQNS